LERTRGLSRPARSVIQGAVPFVVAFGERDLPELVVQNRDMIEALKDAGADVKVIEFAGFNHFDTNESCGSADNEWVRNVRDGMQRL
jgi:acetyl esterase/lipase